MSESVLLEKIDLLMNYCRNFLNHRGFAFRCARSREIGRIKERGSDDFRQEGIGFRLDIDGSLQNP